MESNLFGVASSSASSSSSTHSNQGSSSSSFASTTQITAEGTQTIAASATSSDPGASSAQASASASPDGLTATADAHSSHIEPDAFSPIAISPPPDILTLFPGLVDSSVEEPQGANAGEVAPRPAPIVDYVLGTVADELLVGQAERNLMLGAGGADTFMLSAVGVDTVTRADVVIDFNPLEGDRIGLTGGITVSDLHLQVVDLDHNGIPESTIIRLGASDSILAVALNTVDTAGNTILANDCFLSLPNALEHQIVT